MQGGEVVYRITFVVSQWLLYANWIWQASASSIQEIIALLPEEHR